METSLSLLGRELAEAFTATFDLEPFFKVFDSVAPRESVEMETDLGEIQRAWADLTALAQHFQTDFLPTDLSFASLDKTDSTNLPVQKTVAEPPISPLPVDEVSLRAFQKTENHPLDTSTFHRTVLKPKVADGEAMIHRQNGKTAVSNANITHETAIGQKTLAQLGDLTILNPTESVASPHPNVEAYKGAETIWQKPLGNLGNLSAFTHLESDSEDTEPLKAIFTEKESQKEDFNANPTHETAKTFWQKPLGNLGNLSAFTHLESDSEDTEPSKATFTEKEAQNEINSTPSQPQNWENAFPMPFPERVPFEKQPLDSNVFFTEAPTPHPAKPNEEDLTAQTEYLLDALTQRVQQEFKRFYPSCP